MTGHDADAEAIVAKLEAAEAARCDLLVHHGEVDGRHPSMCPW